MLNKTKPMMNTWYTPPTFDTGYMDISLAPYDSDDWQVLAFAPDEYAYNQDHQQNYTAFVVSSSFPFNSGV